MMGPHHEAWLGVHPHRTREWLSDRLKDGFDIHHTDGDPMNNHPDNLVLIECSDHLMLHTGVRILRMNRKQRSASKKKRLPVPATELDALAYKFGVDPDQVKEWRAGSRVISG